MYDTTTTMNLGMEIGLALLRREYEQADNHLKIAAEAGLEDAKRNMEELAKKNRMELETEE